MYIKNSKEFKKLGDKIYATNPGDGIARHYSLDFSKDVRGDLVYEEEDLQAIIQSYRDEVAIERIIARAEAGDIEGLQAKRSINVPEGVSFDPEINVSSVLSQTYNDYKFKDQMSFEDYCKIVLAGKFNELNVQVKEDSHE